MKMKINELNERELQEVVKLWIETRDSFCWLITLEEFVTDYIRRCENCGEFVVLDDIDEELIKDTTWRGNIISVCQNCYNEEHKNYEVV